MTPERQSADEWRVVDELRQELRLVQADVGDLKTKVRVLEVQSDNRRAQTASAPAWISIVVSSALAILAILINAWAQFGGR